MLLETKQMMVPTIVIVARYKRSFQLSSSAQRPVNVSFCDMLNERVISRAAQTVSCHKAWSEPSRGTQCCPFKIFFLEWQISHHNTAQHLHCCTIAISLHVLCVRKAAQCLAQSREPSAVGLKKKRIFHVHPHFNSIHVSCLSWFFDGRLKRVSLYNACGEHSIYRRFILVSFFVTVLTTIPEEKC